MGNGYFKLDTLRLAASVMNASTHTRSRICQSAFLLLLLCAFGFVGSSAWAQQTGTITGQVIDAENDETLPGANVVVVETNQGAATNADGQYTISGVEPGTYSVRASFVGFQERVIEEVEVVAGETTQVDFRLQPSGRALEEVVVIGYGEQDAENITGSVEQVNEADFNRGNVTSPENLISGKIAGVSISPANGAPGGATQIRIRGATSVNASSSPLFVIDGVPIDNAGNSAQRNPLNFLNPADIKSISVLKDASATAIYGSRGANGVILIETKTGEGQEPSVTYSGSFSSSSATDRVDVLGPDQFREVVRQEAPGQLERLGDTRTDWQDAVERTAFTQEHNLGFSGGDEDSDFRISLGFLNEQGVINAEKFQRVSGSFRYNRRFLDDALSIRTNIRGSKQDRNFEPGIVGGSASMAPTQPIRDVDSPFGGFFEWPEDLAVKNPVAQQVLTESTGETFRSLGNVEAEYDLPFLEGLSTRLKLGYDVQEGENEFFAPTFLKAQADSDEPGSIARNNFSRLNTLVDAFLEYDGEVVDGLDLSFTGGYEFQQFQSEFPEVSGDSLAFNFLRENSLDLVGSLENIRGSVTETQNRLISGFGRFNFTWQDKYSVTYTVRRDGSSRFGPENRWATFQSLSAAWSAHRESFVQDIGFISTLRPKFSWGTSGNQEIGDFSFLPTVSFSGPEAQQQFGNQFITTIRPNAADPGLQWEETTQFDIGLEFGVLEDRVTGSFNYFDKTTDQLLFNVPIPAGSNLSDFLLTNIGENENTGFEIAVDARVLDDVSGFSYDAQFNATYVDRELTNVPRGGEQGLQVGFTGLGTTVQVIREGSPLNAFQLFEQKFDENGNPISDDDPEEMFVDQNDDGVINDQDLVVKESPQPDWIIGHTSRMTFKNVDFQFTMRANVGNWVHNTNAANLGAFNNLSDFDPSNLHESVLTTEFNESQPRSDFFLENASFLRMDNMELGYTVPTEALGTVERIRVFGSIRNAFTITGYSGPDPEVPGGIDNSLFPRSRTFTAGVNVQL